MEEEGIHKMEASAKMASCTSALNAKSLSCISPVRCPSEAGAFGYPLPTLVASFHLITPTSVLVHFLWFMLRF